MYSLAVREADAVLAKGAILGRGLVGPPPYMPSVAYVVHSALPSGEAVAPVPAVPR